jgi:hypothetical protein
MVGRVDRVGGEKVCGQKRISINNGEAINWFTFRSWHLASGSSYFWYFIIAQTLLDDQNENRAN